MKRVLAFACAAVVSGLSHALVISTTDTGTITAFQSGIGVFDFEDAFVLPFQPKKIRERELVR